MSTDVSVCLWLEFGKSGSLSRDGLEVLFVVEDVGTDR